MHDFATTPFAHQAEEFDAHRADTLRRNNWEQGLGKSKLAIDRACALHLEAGLDGLFVLAPSGVHRNWHLNEVPVHLWPSLVGRTLTHLFQTERAQTKWHQAAVLELLRHRGLAILLMSYDGYMTNAGRQAATRFMETRRVLAVLDEASDIKTPSAKRTQAIIRTGWRATWKMTMDGTPISNGPFDVYAPTRFLDDEFWVRRGLSTFAEFKQHFGEWEQGGIWNPHKRNDDGSVGGRVDRLVGFRRLGELREMLAPLTSRVTKEEALDLPEKVYRKRYVALNPEQRRVYNQLRDTYTAELADGRTIEQPLALTRLLRLQQIACGYVPVETDEPVHVLPGTNHRLDALEQEVHAAPSKVLVWARFRLDVDLIMQRLRAADVPAVRFDGAVPEAERAANAQAFQESDGGPRVMVVTQDAGSRGHTWTRAQTVVYYSNTFKLLQRLQSEDRCHRIGQVNKVDYCDLIADDTVDVHTVAALRKKFDIAQEINGDEYRRWI